MNRRHIAAFSACAGLLLEAAYPAWRSGAAWGCPAAPTGNVELAETSALYGWSASFLNLACFGISNARTAIVFERDSRRLAVNGMTVWLNSPAAVHAGRFFAASADFRSIIAPLMQPEAALAGYRVGMIVLDPGHGGEDPGAAGARVLEKDAVLDIALRLAKLLSRAGLGVELTRDRDVSMGLRERVEKARKLCADLLVSIHANSCLNPEAAGVETYALPSAGYPSTGDDASVHREYPGNAHDAASTFLAFCVQNAAVRRLNCADRGVRRARFDLLRYAPCPAVLFECGFLSNRPEAEKLASDEYRAKVAEAMCEGILAFLAETADTPAEAPAPAETASGQIDQQAAE